MKSRERRSPPRASCRSPKVAASTPPSVPQGLLLRSHHPEVKQTMRNVHRQQDCGRIIRPDKHLSASTSMSLEPISVDQFWDRNRLIPPHMEDFLPKNRMLSDLIATLFQLALAVFVPMLIFHVIFHNDTALVVFGLASCSYISASFHTRMRRAFIKCYQARRRAERTVRANASKAPNEV
jgi:hypothetical protein